MTPVLTLKVIFLLNFPALLRPPISTKTGQDGIASFLWGSWILQTAAVAAAADGVEVGTMMFPCLGLSGGMTIVLLESSGGRLCCLSLLTLCRLPAPASDVLATPNSICLFRSNYESTHILT